jgi:hypothetical protein
MKQPKHETSLNELKDSINKQRINIANSKEFNNNNDLNINLSSININNQISNNNQTNNQNLSKFTTSPSGNLRNKNLNYEQSSSRT